MSATEYDTNSDQFKVSPSLVLGHHYQSYRENLYMECVARPAVYGDCRRDVIEKVKLGIVKTIYENLRNVLCKGELDGVKLIKLSKSYVPNYPPTKADEICLSFARACDEKLDEIIDIVIPPYSDVLKNRLEARAI